MTLKIKNPLAIITTLTICIASLMLVMPNDGEKLNYEYQVGQPWRYEPLIAPYEFAISKSEAQMKHDRDSALREFAPYFTMAGNVAPQQLRNFRADYAKGNFHGVPYAYMNHAAKLLEEVYEHGIVDPFAYQKIVENNSPGIRVVNGTSATMQVLENIYSTRTAYQYLMESEGDVYQRDIMARLRLNDYLEPNLLFDSLRSRSARSEVLASLISTNGMVLGGERIIDRGELVTEYKHNVLESLKEENSKRRQDSGINLLVSLGQGGIIVILFAIMLLYLQLFRKDLFEDNHSIYLIFALITVFAAISCLLVKFQLLSVYMVPFAMAPIFVRVFMDTRTAFMTHATMVLIASIPLHTNYQFVLTEMVAGLVAIYSLRDLTERSQLFKTAAYVTLVSWAVGGCFDLSQGVEFGHFDRFWYYSIAINGIFLLFAYPLLYIIERLFGFTSSVTLIELSNINTPILRRMSKEAQGTFVHSMQVGNLAAEVANKIGAKVQLVRTGALYHDIGKMINPAFFTENQSSVNPHDALPEERSAEIIISHVSEGLKLAEKNYLPKVIRDFIITHHGQSLVKYFYVQSCNKHGEEMVDKSLFTYPGKNPFTREQAILMMADSVEAASRSLKEYTEESITSLVNNIIDAQVAAGHFKECPITFRDIADAKRVFIDSLKTIYHTRIAYPEMGKTQSAQPTQPTQPQRSRIFGSNTWTWRKN